MATVLSTKKLKLNQKELLLNSGIGLIEYNAIKIESIEIELKQETIEYVIFTSKNAVKAVSQKRPEIKNCFCVGEKTTALAREIGYNVLLTANNAKDLALIISQDHKNKEFHFFSGNRRRDELPKLLEENNIKYKETRVYNTSLNLRKFDSEFDGIMFFSPSGVQSFTERNKLNTTAFCIGETTAAEAAKHSEKIVVASKPAIENVIAKVVSELKNK
ncbi:uroporphyrinogen-III synthase [Pontixanthobacter gangjinensis]|uniref:Uroporphyrinogen-III synthase n=1 Tax=Christiangramia aestuarii TaxID=1028746 RepID=A0A7K1LRA5_9FLAO|nr:uroporphyrinogen-III synthase [Christiangramia aestuarii]MUP43288.1 uroporphyrinogen-III synthase [Christiangramia aestuarii]